MVPSVNAHRGLPVTQQQDPPQVAVLRQHFGSVHLPFLFLGTRDIRDILRNSATV